LNGRDNEGFTKTQRSGQKKNKKREAKRQQGREERCAHKMACSKRQSQSELSKVGEKKTKVNFSDVKRQRQENQKSQQEQHRGRAKVDWETGVDKVCRPKNGMEAETSVSPSSKGTKSVRKKGGGRKNNHNEVTKGKRPSESRGRGRTRAAPECERGR